MKCLTTLVVLATLYTMVVCETMDEMQQISKACLAEARVTEAELKAYFTNGMKPTDAKDNIKCHMKCMMEKKGHFKNGAFDEAAALTSLQAMPQFKDFKADIEKAIHDCKDEHGVNDCDTAFKITTCLAEYKSNIGGKTK